MPIQRYERQSHPYHNYHHRRFTPPNHRRIWPWIFGIIIVILALISTVAAYLYLRPFPSIKPQVVAFSSPSEQPNINWPTSSQAAIGSVEEGVITSHTDAKLHPTASTAKLITALTVLNKKPLGKGEQGPMITMTQSDIDIYNSYYQRNGSLVQIAMGEKLSQRQMLEGMLLPSANNFADSLAIWAFGSLADYRQAAQSMVESLGMEATIVGDDASGFSPATQSTAEDLVRLGIEAMKQPLIAEIVAQPETNLPIAGIKQSTNWLLGTDGVVGGKTGNTNEAGGVYIFAAKYDLDTTNSTTIVGAVQGESTVYRAIAQARNLLAQAKTNFKLTTPIKKGQVIATYKTQWGKTVKAVASSGISQVSWASKEVNPEVKLSDIAGAIPKGSMVGMVKVGDKSSPVVLSEDVDDPPWQWRVWREAR